MTRHFYEFSGKMFFKSHPNIANERINFESGSEDELPKPREPREPQMTADESDDHHQLYLPHPSVNFNRDKDGPKKPKKDYEFIEHPNITIDRIKSYGSYCKKISCPIFIAKKKHSTATKSSGEKSEGEGARMEIEGNIRFLAHFL